MKNESDRARFFVYRHMDINWLNGNVHRYKKESCSSNFFILGCTGCFWQDRAFEVAEHSEVSALESLASNLVRLAALAVLVALV